VTSSWFIIPQLLFRTSHSTDYMKGDKSAVNLWYAIVCKITALGFATTLNQKWWHTPTPVLKIRTNICLHS